MTRFVFGYITWATEKEARELARVLLTERCIGCANIFPIQSMYWWEGEIEEGSEWVLLVKTTEKMFESVREIVEKNHAYAVPCITKIVVEPNGVYGKWLEREIGEGKGELGEVGWDVEKVGKRR